MITLAIRKLIVNSSPVLIPFKRREATYLSLEIPPNLPNLPISVDFLVVKVGIKTPAILKPGLDRERG